MIPATHRVLLLTQFGGPDAFRVVEQPVPEPGSGEVLVKVLAASVQFTDVILRKGQYPDLEEKAPLILGYDFVGEVVKLGPGVTSPALGTRVADLTMTGSYAQFRLVEAARCTVVDPAVDAGEATSLILSWMTAYQLLHRDARVQASQKLLVLGASGAVGLALIVLGKIAGCEVWGAAREKHHDRVRSLGATPVDAEGADWAKVLPERFDAVFDGIAEGGFSRAWKAVGARGHLSAYGFSKAVQDQTPFLMIGFMFLKLWWWNLVGGKRSTSFYSITKLRKAHPDWFVDDLSVLLGLLSAGKIRPIVAERIPLEGVADAHARIEKGGLDGKIVLVPNG